MIVYLHGLNGSSKGETARSIARYFPAAIIPDYSVHDWNKGIAELDPIIRVIEDDDLIIVGNSTGALYAEYFAEKYKRKSVLINPVVDPSQLVPLIGTQHNPEPYQFTQEHVDSFQVVDHYNGRLVFINRNDPVLDARIAINKYKDNSRVIINDDASHRFTRWDVAVPEIERFLNTYFL